MKTNTLSLKCIFFVFLAFFGMKNFSGFAQEIQHEIPQHEINYNLLGTLVFASVEVGYEYFIDYDQSVGMELMINDRRNLRPKKSGEKYNTHAIQLNYTYYFGKENPGSGIYVQPLVRYRFGSFKEQYGQKKTDMNGFVIGVGTGYIWNLSNSFVFGPFANIGRNFGKEVGDRFTAIEYHAGFNIAYRF